MSYHTNSVGEPSWCIAEASACRIHSDAEHYPTPDAARQGHSQRSDGHVKSRRTRLIDRFTSHIIWP